MYIVNFFFFLLFFFKFQKRKEPNPKRLKNETYPCSIRIFMRIINQKTKNSKLLNYSLALYLSFHVKLKGKNLISRFLFRVFFVFY
jgi:hypothetical protein